ncbi:MAG: pilus assembly protein TadG-related protein [Thermoguttaceae bacterium]|jgi:hypothetical protein|nr:pilus assembly protein TadG-related protein [Thermoguttaceae bacterium]
MRQPFAHPSPAVAIHRRNRQGAIGVLLLLSMSVTLAMAALVINLGWLWCHHHKFQSACEAAALAGASELIDDGFLYAGTCALSHPDDGDASPKARRLRRAKQQAARFAAANGVTIDLGDDNEYEEASNAVVTAAGLFRSDPRDAEAGTARAATGEVVVWQAPAGGLDDASEGNAQAEYPTAGPAARQGVIVRVGAETKHGNPLVLWLGGITGVTRGDVVAEAGAVLDQRALGFRPAGHLGVPLVPVAISVTSSSTERFWGVVHADRALGQAQATASGESVQDDFSVDSRTGAVRGGPNGIPEVLLRIRVPDPSKPDEGGEPTAWAVSLPGPDWNVQRFDAQVRGGLRADDLTLLGGEIALREAAGLRLPGPAIEKAHLGRLREAMASIRGMKRAWMLGSPAGDGSITVVGFVAACVVDCREESDSSLALWVEPCVLVTPTLLVGRGHGPNPFLGKVALER